MAKYLELHLIGTGSERKQLQDLVQHLGVEQKVNFHGQIQKNILKLISLISKSKAKIYTPPSAWKELKNILENKKVPKKDIRKLDVHVIQKAPSRMELLIPAEFIYQYVIEIRGRFNKGLREAEKAVLRTQHKKESHAKVIKELRDKYRVAIRKGVLDSKEDLDVLLLAKELNADVVARDEGIREWAEKWGIRYISPRSFPRLLRKR